MTEAKRQDVEKEKMYIPKSDLCSKLGQHCFFTLQKYYHIFINFSISKHFVVNSCYYMLYRQSL